MVHGYHFWYKYYVDENDPAGDNLDAGGITVLTKESVTFKFKELDHGGIIRKPMGGFFTGCSPEGLMALGTYAEHLKKGGQDTIVASINNSQFEMEVYYKEGHLYTTYPMFKSGDFVYEGKISHEPHTNQPHDDQKPKKKKKGKNNDTPPEPQQPQFDINANPTLIATIVSIKVDDNKSKVTVSNKTEDLLAIEGWKLVGESGHEYHFSSGRLRGGANSTMDVNDHFFGGSGDTVYLVDHDGHVVHRVKLSEGTNNKGWLLFNH